MQYKTILMRFPRELTVEEENKLISTFHSVVAGIRTGLRNAIAFVNGGLYKKFNKNSEVQAFQYQTLLDHINDYVRLEKPDAKEYLLKIAVSDLNTFNFNMPGSREKVGDRLAKRFLLLSRSIERTLNLDAGSIEIGMGEIIMEESA